MQTKTVATVTITEAMSKHLPRVGSLVRGPTGSLKRVSFIRRLVSDRGGVRVGLESVRKSEAPEGTAVPSWPKGAPGRPKAEPPAARIAQAIETYQRRKRDERNHVVALLADDRDDTPRATKARIDNETVQDATWVDPDDLNPGRRTPREIHGKRTFDVIAHMLDNRSISRAQGRAARKIRDSYDRGVVGLRLGFDRLMGSPTGFAAGSGPSEVRSEALEAYNQAVAAVGEHSLFPIILDIVIGNMLITAYAKRNDVQVLLVRGRLTAGLDRLSEHYTTIEKLESASR